MNPLKLDEVNIEMGSHQCITLDKVFGPLSMNNLRVSIDSENGEWIVERHTKNMKWEVVAKINGCLYNEEEKHE